MPVSVTNLNHSPADVMRFLLIALGLGTEPRFGTNWPVNVSNEPATPDNVITLYDTEAGAQDERVMSGEMACRYGFQVRVRAIDDPTGWQKINSIRESLALLYEKNLTIGSEVYEAQASVKIGNIIPLGRDVGSSMRSLFVLNAMAVIRRVS